METIPCPGCRTALGPEITVCPICTRPRSKYEITRAYATLRAEQARRRKRPYIIGGWVLAATAVGWLGFKFRAPLSAAAAAAHARYRRFVDEATDPKHLSPAAARETASTPEQEPAGPPIAAASSADAPPPPGAVPAAAPPPGVGAVRSPSANGAAPSGVAAPARPKVTGDLPVSVLDPGTQWALRGWVYDLMTLKPVPSASFVVRGPNGGLFASFASDPDGRYLVILPRVEDGGYTILSSQPGYAAPVYDESDIPYAQLSASERRELTANARVGDNHPSPLADIVGENSVHRDLFVVPLR
jgi:hypothetical protein